MIKWFFDLLQQMQLYLQLFDIQKKHVVVIHYKKSWLGMSEHYAKIKSDKNFKKKTFPNKVTGKTKTYRRRNYAIQIVLHGLQIY